MRTARGGSDRRPSAVSAVASRAVSARRSARMARSPGPGAIAHARQLDQTVQAMAKVQEAMCGELGMDHRAIVSEGRSLPPGVKAKRTMPKKIAVENKGGALMSAVTLGLMIAQIAAKLLGVHFVLP